MLLQPEHEHEASRMKEQPKMENHSREVVDSSSNKKHSLPPPPVQKPQSAFFNSQSYHETSSFNFYIDGLEEIHKESEQQLEGPVIEAIMMRKKFSQERIYEAIVNNSNDFVSVHMKDFKSGLKQELKNLFENIHESVQAGIWDGHFDIGKRNNYFSINKKEGELVAYITEELVKKNISSFRQELEDSQIGSDYLTVSVGHRAKSQVAKVKKAEQFIKKMHQEQLKHEEFLNRKKAERHELEVKSMQEKQTQQQQKKQQKRQLVLKRIERHKQMTEMEQEHKKKMQNQYLKFITSSQKPLHKVMQERYEKIQREEQKIKLKKLKKLMKDKQPISFDQINEHMDRYDELRYQHQQYRNEKRELKEYQMQIIAHNRPYRSKFYSIVAKRSPRQDFSQLRTSLIKKQTDFSEHVKRNFMPKTDEKKHQQLEDLIKKIANHKKANYHSRKHIQEGNRNLQKLHLLICQLRAKNKLKQNLGLEEIIEKKPGNKYKNYLQEVKQSRLVKDPISMSVDYEKKLRQRDQEYVKMQAKIKQSKAKQQDLYLDSAIATMDFDSHMNGKKMVQHDFIEAANAKLAILKKYNLSRGETIDVIQ